VKIRRRKEPTCKSLDRIMPLMEKMLRESFDDARERGFVGYFDRHGNIRILETCMGGYCSLLPKTILSYIKGVSPRTAPEGSLSSALVGNFFFHTHPQSGSSVPSPTDARTFKLFDYTGWCVAGYDFDDMFAAHKFRHMAMFIPPTPRERAEHEMWRHITPVVRCVVRRDFCPVKRGKWAILYKRNKLGAVVSGEKAEVRDRRLAKRLMTRRGVKVEGPRVKT